MIENYVSTEKV